MAFPPHIATLLDVYGVQPATKAALYDLFVMLGSEVLEEFATVVERGVAPSAVTPEDLTPLRASIVSRFVQKNHPRWAAGKATESLWHPRILEGRAAGMAMPLGHLGRAEEGFPAQVAAAVRTIVGDSQPVPNGILMLGKNAHYGGRDETVTFDVIPDSVDEAQAVALALGQQHSLPGSVGETAGSVDSMRSIALIWEVQPNVYKPTADRNAAIAKLHRRHRNWHVATLAAALLWLAEKRYQIYVVRGVALAATHEVNPQKPVTPAIVDFHERTVGRVVAALHGIMAPATDSDGEVLLESHVMNTGLRTAVERDGAASAIHRIEGALAPPE